MFVYTSLYEGDTTIDNLACSSHGRSGLNRLRASRRQPHSPLNFGLPESSAPLPLLPQLEGSIRAGRPRFADRFPWRAEEQWIWQPISTADPLFVAPIQITTFF